MFLQYIGEEPYSLPPENLGALKSYEAAPGEVLDFSDETLDDLAADLIDGGLFVEVVPGPATVVWTVKDAPLTLPGGGSILSGDGVPDELAGALGAIYIQRDADAEDPSIFRCTEAGDAGDATWLGLV